MRELYAGALLLFPTLSLAAPDAGGPAPAAQRTARAYITVVAQHRLVAASETARETAKAHYDYAHKRLAGGIGRAIDEVRAQQDLATVETQRQANLARLALAQEALGVLLAA